MSDTSRPTSPQQDLWSSILDSVSSTRSIPSKNVLILGEPSTGKSTLSNALLQKTVDHNDHKDGEWSGKSDFAIGYEWGNVKDDGEEDILARLSVYTVPSSSKSHLALLPNFLPPRTSLSQTLVMIVLDWTKPWSFIEQLETWLAWVEQWAEAKGVREVVIAREEGHERLQSHIQHYTEPSSSTAVSDPLPAAASSLNSTLLPLGNGTLTHNVAGIPIIVTCTKADLIDEEGDAGMGMVKGKGGEWEERTDAIMQVLRTICLKYGAALFYTTAQPVTLSILRQYVLHFLSIPPPPPPDTAPLKNPFPFTHQSNTLDRDQILVPAGWDSWGKIGVLREEFHPAKWGEGWERDMEGVAPGPSSAKEMFKVLVGDDHGIKAQPLPPLIVTEPEHAFLSKHYETLQKDPSRDPRQTFRQPTSSDPHASGAGVVGPMGSSSLSLPSVERAMMELEGEDVAARLMRAGAGRREPPRTQPPPAISIPSAATNPPAANANRLSASFTAPPPASPGGASSGAVTPGGGKSEKTQTQHEVLQRFFDSLLTNRAAAGGAPAAAGAKPTAPATNGTGTSGGTGTQGGSEEA